jgi:hypothetical protein
MNDLLEIVARSNGSATLPSLGNILFVSSTGSTTQSRADGLGRIDKPFKLQRAFDVAQPNDIIIIYGAISTTYSVSVNQLRIFMYCGSITINFNNTSAHQIYCYNIGNTITINIQNIVNGRVNVFGIGIQLNLTNCNGLNVSSEQSCIISPYTHLSNCTFKSNMRSTFFSGSSVSPSFSNLNIDNFNITSSGNQSNFSNCTFNKSIFSHIFYNSSVISNCFFYDSRVDIRYSLPNTLEFRDNKFVRCLIDFTNLGSTSTLASTLFYATINKFVNCVLHRNTSNSVRINNSTWILKNCIIRNPNPLSSPTNLGFFRVFSNCNLYLIDCKYEVPASSPYAISNNYTGELQLINCQLPTNITGGKTPTITSNVFIGDLPNINDVLDNI